MQPRRVGKTLVMSDGEGVVEHVDLGVIVAHPVERDSPDRGEPAVARSRVVSVSRLRGGTTQVFSNLVDAHRGPKVNSRPVPGWVRSLAWFLDESIPVGGQRRVGVDGVVSVIPGIGDAAGLVASMVVVLAGVGVGVSLPTLTLMLVHVGIDTIVGTVPFLGAFFDLGYKANTRNLRLIERDLADRAATRRSVLRVFLLSVVAMMVGFLLFLIALIGSVYLFARLLAGLF